MLQQFEGIDRRADIDSEAAAKFVNVEREARTCPVANGNLQIVADRFVALFDRFERRKFALDAAVDSCLILRPDQQHGVCTSSVTSRTPRLLVVLFERFAHRIVDHKTDVSLVDTHTESVGSHHYTCAPLGPRRLAHCSLGVPQTAVVEVGRDTVLGQKFRKFLHSIARTHIDNARARNLVDHTQQLLVLVLDVAHHILQIGTCKATAQHVRLAKAQLAHNILSHQVGCRGGQRQHGRVGNQTSNLGNAQVRRTEIVSPLRDTVRLIDRQQ